jgi:hypothetical protein
MTPFLTLYQPDGKPESQKTLSQGDGLLSILPPFQESETTTGQGEILVGGCELSNQNFWHTNCHTPPGGHQKTSPLREMVRHGRLSDCFEFLANYYGIEGEQESLEILGRFRHA